MRLTETSRASALVRKQDETPFAPGLLSEITAALVRDPSRRTSSQSCTGEFMSLTTGRRLVFESLGERDLLLMLDVDYRTVSVSSQPERFRVHNGARWTSYVPDVLAASLHGERCYFQVKRGDRLVADPTLNGRIEAIDAESRARGAQHRLCPREALRVGPRLANSKWIHAAATAIDPAEARRVAALLGRFRSPCPIGDLRASGLDARLRNCLLGMVGHREVAIRLSSPIEDVTEVFW